MTKITPQIIDFCQLVSRGVAPEHASTYLGLTTEEGQKLLRDPYVLKELDNCSSQLHPELYKFQGKKPLEFTRDDATMLLFEAHRKAANSMEEIKAVSELIKLHGIQAPEKKEITIKSDNQLKELSDEELLKLTGSEAIDLEEAEWEEIEDAGHG